MSVGESTDDAANLAALPESVGLVSPPQTLDTDVGDGRGVAEVGDLWSHVVEELAAPAGGVETTLQRLAERISRVLNAGTVICIVSVDEVLDPLGFADVDSTRLAALRKLFSGDRPKVGEGVLGRVAESGRGLLVDADNPVPQNDRFHAYRGFAELWDINSFIVMPMVSGGDVIGVLGVGRHGESPPLTTADAPLVERLADVVGRSARVAVLMEHGRMAEAALDGINDAVVAVDQDCRITYWNGGAQLLFGFGEAEVLGHPIARIMRPTELEDETSEREWLDSLCRGDSGDSRLELLSRSGRSLTVEVRATSISAFAEPADGAGLVLVLRDVGADLAARQAAARSERLAQAALDASPMMSSVADVDGKILVASAAWKSRFGDEWSEGASLWGAMSQVAGDDDAEADFRRRFHRVASEDRPRSHGDYEAQVDGETRTFSVHYSQVVGVGVSITIADITDRASRERNLSYEATHDVLTRLPNRSVLLDRAERALSRAARTRDRVGLLFCDLDAFKELNDVHGHDIGDEVLEILASRLVDSCRLTDTVVRLHGDEFAILIEDAVDSETVQVIAERVVASMADPMKTTVGRISVSASVGLVLASPRQDEPPGVADVERLLRQADAAMYAAKRRGKNRWVAYDETLRVAEERADAFMGDLLRGAGSGEFILHVQPQFDVSGTLVSGEALLRWDHPERGLIEPFEVFQHGWDLPMSIGDWVVRQSAVTLAMWADKLPDNFRLGINLSSSQWLDRKTPGYVLDSLERAEVSPNRIRIEVSQEALSADPTWSVTASESLAQAGVHMAVNSFGVGIARLSDLARPTIHSILLARRLVRDSATSGGGLELLRGCVALAHSMGWNAVATGVENAGQREAVTLAGCDYLQGYHLGRPVEERDFERIYLHGASQIVTAHDGR